MIELRECMIIIIIIIIMENQISYPIFRVASTVSVSFLLLGIKGNRVLNYCYRR